MYIFLVRGSLIPQDVHHWEILSLRLEQAQTFVFWVRNEVEELYKGGML